MVSIVVGGHYGDEGKGKIVSYLAQKDDPDVISRSGVGPNAGHTVWVDGKKYGLRMITCGFVNPNARLLIGAGVLVDPGRFLDEIKTTDTDGRIFIDQNCSIIEQKHKDEDKKDGGKIGTTGTGCGPAMSDRVMRTAKQAKEIPQLKDYVTDVPLQMNEAIDAGKKVLIEGTQGFGLSLYYGNYPYVTSKDTSASTAAADVGIGPTNVDDVYVIYKAYMSRVGKDPYIHYLDDKDVEGNTMWRNVLERAKKQGIEGENVNEIIATYLGEVGTVTGRPRKIGSFDFELARYSAKVNGATQICVTCLDKLFPECAGAKEKSQLSEQALDHVKAIEESVGVKATLISTGPDVYDVIDLR
ncbi:MAG: adenylosuccinate synthetase [Candidatus Altiarchaeales archaeon]|nr:adenylosuccinate synthetase [Candidatus Altiarchaeales archaeon]